MENTTMKIPRILYQILFGISAGLSAMSAGVWLAWHLVTIHLIDFDYLNTKEKGNLLAFIDFGNIIIIIPACYLMNYLGRRQALMVGSFSTLLAVSLLLFFHDTFSLVAIANSLAGVTVGITLVVLPVYLVESASADIRGSISTIFIGFLNVGMMFAFIVGPSYGYFGLSLMNFAISVMFLFFMMFFPDSPYNSLVKGHKGSAKLSLSRFLQTGRNRNAELEIEFSRMEDGVKRDMKQKMKFVNLLKHPPYRRALIIVTFLIFFQRSTGISAKLEFGPSISPCKGNPISKNEYMTYFCLFLAIGNFSAIPMVDKIGRKPVLTLSCLFTAITTGVESAFFNFKSSMDVCSYDWIPKACYFSYAVSYSIGLGFIPFTLVCELFPINARCYASSVTAVMIAAASFSINKFFFEIRKMFGYHNMCFYSSICCLACIIFIYIALLETKMKSLEEIQDEIILPTRKKSLEKSYEPDEATAVKQYEPDEATVWKQYEPDEAKVSKQDETIKSGGSQGDVIPDEMNLEELD